MIYLSKFYVETGVHPISTSLLKSIISGLIGIIMLKFLTFLFVDTIAIAHLIALAFIFVGMYLLLFLVSGGLETEDKDVILAIEKRLGLNLVLVKRLIEKFN